MAWHRVCVWIFVGVLLACTSGVGYGGEAVLAPNDVCFGVNLYKQVGTKPGNLFFSPLSFTTALAMTQTGARGQTEKEMSTAGCLPYDAATILSLFGDLLKKLNEAGGTNELRVANSLWAQHKYPFLPEYLKSVQEAFSARVEN
ncbi:MAG TPA: serpin family protein, partial [Candidatus Ozemobacteraceae bacterium]|nr:serpin family protein [Candidatus Ozemobacteraceae bacterium]